MNIPSKQVFINYLEGKKKSMSSLSQIRIYARTVNALENTINIQDMEEIYQLGQKIYTQKIRLLGPKVISLLHKELERYTGIPFDGTYQLSKEK